MSFFNAFVVSFGTIWLKLRKSSNSSFTGVLDLGEHSKCSYSNEFWRGWVNFSHFDSNSEVLSINEIFADKLSILTSGEIAFVGRL